MTFPLPSDNPVWKHFQMLCAIPRPSKHEQAVREALKSWAEARGLATHLDSAGNLIVRKPATPGMENRKTVVLQGHLDMVCQKNAGTEHDFHRDPIRPVLKDGWLVAEQTTLGADNGIGVSMALALLESTDIAHGPLEALFTLDEEAGMGGALGLDTDVLTGELLINIDTEDWGEFYLGCAGGVDVNITRAYVLESLQTGFTGLRLTVKGLRGGHSGVNIHEERGSAIKLLIRILRQLEQRVGLRLVEFNGGTARNALAREANALVAIPESARDVVASELAGFQTLFRHELAGVDEGVLVESASEELTQVMSEADQAAILGFLHAAPHGVKRMSQRVPGVVETSNNMGVVRIAQGELFVNFMVRSLLASGTTQLADEIASLASLVGADVEREGAYPGWAPNPNSALLEVFQQVYARQYGERAEVKVIHAGLECGILGAKYPKMDMVSFGPNIRGAHAPGERVEIASVEKTWELLKAVIAEIPAVA